METKITDHAEPEHTKLVEIIIDKCQKISPTPTTGVALYKLGEVQSGYELFRDVKHGHDDELIKNDGTEYQLVNDEMFFTAKNVLNPGAIA
jgi:hypothetical protein